MSDLNYYVVITAAHGPEREVVNYHSAGMTRSEAERMVKAALAEGGAHLVFQTPLRVDFSNNDDGIEFVFLAIPSGALRSVEVARHIDFEEEEE